MVTIVLFFDKCSHLLAVTTCFWHSTACFLLFCCTWRWTEKWKRERNTQISDVMKKKSLQWPSRGWWNQTSDMGWWTADDLKGRGVLFIIPSWEIKVKFKVFNVKMTRKCIYIVIPFFKVIFAGGTKSLKLKRVLTATLRRALVSKSSLFLESQCWWQSFVTRLKVSNSVQNCLDIIETSQDVSVFACMNLSFLTWNAQDKKQQFNFMQLWHCARLHNCTGII